MKIEKVNCLVTLDNEGKETIITQVPKAGPSAISVTEIPLIQAQNGPNSVTRVHSAGFFETEKSVELARLAEIYPTEFMGHIYPGAHAPLPKTIADLDLPSQHLHDAPKPAEVVEPVLSKDDEIAKLKAQLAEALTASPEPDLAPKTSDVLSETPASPPVITQDTPQVETKESIRAALKEAGVEVPLGNFGIPALKEMMPKMTEDA